MTCFLNWVFYFLGIYDQGRSWDRPPHPFIHYWSRRQRDQEDSAAVQGWTEASEGRRWFPPGHCHREFIQSLVLYFSTDMMIVSSQLNLCEVKPYNPILKLLSLAADKLSYPYLDNILKTFVTFFRSWGVTKVFKTAKITCWTCKRNTFKTSWTGKACKNLRQPELLKLKQKRKRYVNLFESVVLLFLCIWWL